MSQVPTWVSQVPTWVSRVPTWVSLVPTWVSRVPTWVSRVPTRVSRVPTWVSRIFQILLKTSSVEWDFLRSVRTQPAFRVPVDVERQGALALTR